jgi:uncharacterized protein (TIGR03083 family)
VALQDRKVTIRSELVSAQQDLLGVLNRVGPDDWQRPTPNEGWTVRDLLVHLTTSESGFVPTLKKMAAGEGGVPRDFDPNRWNAGQQRRRVESDPAQLRQELEAAHADMLALLDAIETDDALNHTGWMSSGVEGTTEDNFRLVASHKRSHTENIRDALSLAAR